MTDQDFHFHNVTFITADAIGEPGQRVFFLQTRQDEHTISFIMEKIQAESLGIALAKLLSEVANKYPELQISDFEFVEADMHIHPPIDPLFRIGEISMGYEESSDQVILILREILFGEVNDENARKVTLQCSRTQIAKLSSWLLEVVNHGRPICPYCNQPVDADHICPKKNGHKH